MLHHQNLHICDHQNCLLQRLTMTHPGTLPEKRPLLLGLPPSCCGPSVMARSIRSPAFCMACFSLSFLSVSPCSKVKRGSTLCESHGQLHSKAVHLCVAVVGKIHPQGARRQQVMRWLPQITQVCVDPARCTRIAAACCHHMKLVRLGTPDRLLRNLLTMRPLRLAPVPPPDSCNNGTDMKG